MGPAVERNIHVSCCLVLLAGILRRHHRSMLESCNSLNPLWSSVYSARTSGLHNSKGEDEDCIESSSSSHPSLCAIIIPKWGSSLREGEEKVINKAERTMNYWTATGQQKKRTTRQKKRDRKTPPKSVYRERKCISTLETPGAPWLTQMPVMTHIEVSLNSSDDGVRIYFSWSGHRHWWPWI